MMSEKIVPGSRWCLTGLMSVEFLIVETCRLENRVFQDVVLADDVRGLR